MPSGKRTPGPHPSIHLSHPPSLHRSFTRFFSLFVSFFSFFHIKLFSSHSYSCHSSLSFGFSLCVFFSALLHHILHIVPHSPCSYSHSSSSSYPSACSCEFFCLSSSSSGSPSPLVRITSFLLLFFFTDCPYSVAVCLRRQEASIILTLSVGFL